MPHRTEPNLLKVFDGAANSWRKVVIDSVSVRWVDLGTRLILRHVVRALGAEGSSSSSPRKQRGYRADESNKTRGDDENSLEKSAMRTRTREQEGAKRVTRGGHTEAGEQENSPCESGDDAERQVATAEVDLSEIRWAESTESDRRQSASQAQRLLGEQERVRTFRSWGFLKARGHDADGFQTW